MENFNTTLTSLEDMSYATGMGNDTMHNFDSYYSYMNYSYYETDMENDNVDNFDSEYSSLAYIGSVINVVTLCIELPVICWAVFALYHQTKAGHLTHVYVINLLISDLIQIIGRLMGFLLVDSPLSFIVGAIVSPVLFWFGIGASILFMMCIALERYLLVVHPLWYRYRRTIKHSILISLAAYVFDLLLIIAGLLTDFFFFSFRHVLLYGYAIFFIVPLPLLVFFLVATWRALSHSISVSHKEKKRMLGTLALVLLIYLVLFFPIILLFMIIVSLSLFEKYKFDIDKIYVVATLFLYITPLMDCLLYILIKKDTRYTLVPHCCRRLCTHTESRETSTVRTENITSV